MLYFINTSLYIKCGKVSVRNGGRGQLSSEWCHNEDDVIMRTGAATAVGTRHHNENDVTMTAAGLWRHVATGCTALITRMIKTWFTTYMKYQRLHVHYMTTSQHLTVIFKHERTLQNRIKLPVKQRAGNKTSVKCYRDFRLTATYARPDMRYLHNNVLLLMFEATM